MKPKQTSTEIPVTKYIVVYGVDMDDLARRVESMLAKGWHVMGGVCFSTWRFYRAMVK